MKKKIDRNQTTTGLSRLFRSMLSACAIVLLSAFCSFGQSTQVTSMVSIQKQIMDCQLVLQGIDASTPSGSINASDVQTKIDILQTLLNKTFNASSVADKAAFASWSADVGSPLPPMTSDELLALNRELFDLGIDPVILPASTSTSSSSTGSAPASELKMQTP